MLNRKVSSGFPDFDVRSAVQAEAPDGQWDDSVAGIGQWEARVGLQSSRGRHLERSRDPMLPGLSTSESSGRNNTHGTPETSVGEQERQLRSNDGGSATMRDSIAAELSRDFSY